MAAAHWKPKSLDLALPIFLLLLILLPEARYNQHTAFEIYFFPSSQLISFLPSGLLFLSR